MDGKTLLLRNKDLAAWWATVAKDERFSQVMLLAQSELFGQPDCHVGAKRLIALLETFADNPDANRAFPSPGLTHEMPTKSKP